MRRSLNIEHLFLGFVEGQERPANEHIESAEIERQNGSRTRVLKLAHDHGRLALEKLGPKLKDGDSFIVKVIDEDGHWRSLHAGNAEWPAPTLLVLQV